MLNNPHQAPPIDKHGEFMKGHRPTFSHTSNPLEADDWLRAVERQLDIAQCDDHEKVLYASGQLKELPKIGGSHLSMGVLTMLLLSHGRNSRRILGPTMSR